MVIRIEIRVVKGHHRSLSRGPICKGPFWKGPFGEETLALALVCLFVCVLAEGLFTKLFCKETLALTIDDSDFHFHDHVEWRWLFFQNATQVQLHGG